MLLCASDWIEYYNFEDKGICVQDCEDEYWYLSKFTEFGLDGGYFAVGETKYRWFEKNIVDFERICEELGWKIGTVDETYLVKLRIASWILLTKQIHFLKDLQKIKIAHS